MTRQEAARLYGLALMLIPDPDVAGDLLLRSRDEADLRRRAAAWREVHGLPEQLGGRPPALDEEQEAHAWHLVRRGQMRRRLMAGALLAGVGALTAALLVLVPSVLPDPQAQLANAPEFRLTPETGRPIEGLTFEVYKAEASPGKVTLWWGLSGTGAAAFRHLQPTLYTAGPNRFEGNRVTTPTQEMEPAHTELALVRTDRILGVSTYHTFIRQWETMYRFTLSASGDRNWSLLVPLSRGPARNGATSSVNRSVQMGGVTATLLEVVRGDSYTLLRYRVTGSTGLAGRILRSHPHVAADGKPLTVMGTWAVEPTDPVATVVYEALPADAAGLSVRFGPFNWDQTSHAYDLSTSAHVLRWSQQGSDVTVELRYHEALAPLRDIIADRATMTPGGTLTSFRIGVGVFFVDERGQRHRVSGWGMPGYSSGDYTVRLVGRLPSDARAVGVVVDQMTPIWFPDLNVDVKQKK